MNFFGKAIIEKMPCSESHFIPKGCIFQEKKSARGRKSLGEVLAVEYFPLWIFFFTCTQQFQRKSMESDFDSCEYWRNSSVVVLTASKPISFLLHSKTMLKVFIEGTCY